MEMAQTLSQSLGTWTVFPSLLPTLLQEEQRAALEEAAFAQACGRYRDAHSVFDSRLPKSSTLPILALQRADMLSAQGCEHERSTLLQAALQVVSTTETALSPVRLLMEMMLADAQFWAFGEMDPAVGLLPSVRDLLRTSGMENLSDVEIRCVTLYYGVVDSFEGFSNFVGQSDKTIFRGFQGDKGLELKRLRKILHSQGRWRFVPTLMQLELKHTNSGPTFKDAVTDAMNLCDVLEKSVEAPLVFRSVILKKQLASKLSGTLPPLAADLERQYIRTIKRIMATSYTSWEYFCPTVAFDIAKVRILDSQSSYAEKLDQLLDLVQDAEGQRNYTKANEVFISSRNVAREWFQKVKGTDSTPVALKRLRAIQESFLKFHQERTGMAFFEAYACSDYQTTLSINYHDYSTMLKQGEDFQKRNPRFGVPRQQERLYDNAINAARHLGMINKQKLYTERYQKWLQYCNFIKGVALTNDGISESELVNREIITSGDDFGQWGVNAIRVMLRWAGSEWQQDLMSARDCELLFGPGLKELPQEDLARYLGAEVDVVSASRSIFGSCDEPTNTLLFLNQYRRLRDWILIPDRLPSRSTRITVLRIFMESRLYRVRQSLVIKGELPSINQVIALEEEYQALAEIERLEKEESCETIGKQEMNIWARIHATLLKSFSTEAIQSGLVKDTELMSRVADCQELILRQRNNRNLVGQYRATVQLMSLTWQRFLHFKTVAPEEIMPLVNEAEDLFIEIRNNITGLDPSEDLAAKAQLSQDFSHREHYNFALAASLSAFDLFTAQANSALTEELLGLASQNYQGFLHWTLRSKGRGFTDILNLETSVARTIESSKAQPEPYYSTERFISNEDNKSQTAMPRLENKLEAIYFPSSEASNPFDGATATKKQIDEMLQSLPEGVVLVDFVDVRYGQDPTTFVAIVYRKGQKNLPTRIPNMNIAKIDRWVQENLEIVKKDEPRRLGGTDALKRLEILSGLLEPLIRTGSQATIQRGETVILCPTGSLNRIPIHAIPVDGKPFIERNPIVYCQSLTILRWLWFKHQNRSVTIPHPKSSVINPMPDFWKEGKPVASTGRVANLAGRLHADFQHGFDLQNSTVLKAVEGSSIFHYHGHVVFNSRSALDSVMILNQKAYKAVNVRRAGCEAVAAREFFKIQLGDLALATIIGCGSGITAISSTDDVLGLPTALFYAGAGAVVSTLWSIDDEDGAAFATEFYEAITEQRKTVASTAAVVGADDGTNIFDRTIDLARAMQTAVLKLRTDPTRNDRQVPYHWAGFTLNGLWMLPDRIFPDL